MTKQSQRQGQGQQTEEQRLALLHAADELNSLVRLWDATSRVWNSGVDMAEGDMRQLPVLNLLFDEIAANLRRSADLIATARGEKPTKIVRLLRRVS